MARILKGITELGREECERRVARAFEDGEAISTALLVVTSSIESMAAMVPAKLNVAVETSSVKGFDDLMVSAMGGAL